MKQKLMQKLQKLGLAPTEQDVQKLTDFFSFLTEENKKFNLTAITNEDEAIDKHFADSLAAAPLFEGASLAVDVGSGAGFPGIPLAVMCKDTRFTLLDSLNKRVKFLSEAISLTGIKNALALHSRAEDFARQNMREGFDIATARAVAPLNTLCEYCLPLVKVGGRFLAYKTDDSAELAAAQNAITLLGGKHTKTLSFTLPDTEIKRTVIVIEKIAPTPLLYPRGKNKEKSNPL